MTYEERNNHQRKGGSSMSLTQKVVAAGIGAAAFLAAATMTFAQTATTSPTPTTTQSMPSGAPNTGLGGGQ